MESRAHDAQQAAVDASVLAAATSAAHGRAQQVEALQEDLSHARKELAEMAEVLAILAK